MIVRSKRRLSFALFITFSALRLSVGCSGPSDDLPREAVSGAVTLDNEPLASGVITFIPAGGSSGGGPSPGGGGEISNGSFSIARENGLVPGNYSVSIYASAKQEAKAKPEQIGGTKKERQLAKELIPAKYNAKTELKAEIKKGGASDLKFALESK